MISPSCWLLYILIGELKMHKNGVTSNYWLRYKEFGRRDNQLSRFFFFFFSGRCMAAPTLSMAMIQSGIFSMAVRLVQSFGCTKAAAPRKPTEAKRDGRPMISCENRITTTIYNLLCGEWCCRWESLIIFIWPGSPAPSQLGYYTSSNLTKPLKAREL